MLLHGPPGCGKTTTLWAFLHDLFGPRTANSRVLSINASTERGIDTVRVKVKNFCKTAVNTDDADPSFPCPPFKFVFLDEADALTIEVF